MNTKNIEVKSFTSAAKAFFGLKPDQSLRDFLAETQELTSEDKQEIAEGLKQNGITIV